MSSPGSTDRSFPTASWSSSRRSARPARRSARSRANSTRRVDTDRLHAGRPDVPGRPSALFTTTTWPSVGITRSRPCRPSFGSSTASRSNAPSAGIGRTGNRSPESTGLGDGLPEMAAGVRLDERRSRSRRRAASPIRRERARFATHRRRRRRGRDGDDVQPRVDRRPARRAADRGAGDAHAHRHDAIAGRHRRDRAARPRRTSRSRRSPSLR